MLNVNSEIVPDLNYPIKRVSQTILSKHEWIPTIAVSSETFFITIDSSHYSALSNLKSVHQQAPKKEAG